MDNTDKKSSSWGTLIAIGSGSNTVELTTDKTSIGRKQTNDVKIANNKLSASHCCIHREGGSVFVQDLSSNGTYINDAKMSKGAKLPLNDGDKVWLLHPSKIKDPVGYEFKLTSVPIVPELIKETNTLKRDSAVSSDKVSNDNLLKKQQEVKKQKADSDDFKKSIKEQITCAMCLEIMFIPVAVHPCNHRFCGSCLTSLVKSKKPECITCRKQITTAQRDSSFTSIIEDYLKNHPQEKRSAQEQEDLKKNNMFGQDTVNISELIHGKVANLSVPADTSSGQLLKSGRAPGVRLVSTTVPKPKKGGRKGSDLSAASSDNEAGSSAKCRECVVQRNGFKCSPSQNHVACGNCKKLMAQRNDDSLHQRCVICQQHFCNLYFPPCRNSGNKLTLIRDHIRSARIEKDNFRGNDFELTTYNNYLASKKMSAKNAFEFMMKEYLDKGLFNYLIDKKILSVAPARSHEIPIQSDSAVCDVCWKQLWFQLVMRHRMNINSQLPPAISSRADCYYGINCSTMGHKLDHAKKLNHCCYQTRFH